MSTLCFFTEVFSPPEISKPRQTIFSSQFYFISVPRAAPVVSVSDTKTTTSLIISWTAIPEEYVTGELLGFYVTYKPIRIGDQRIERIDETKSITVTALATGNHELTLNSLSSFTQYSITVAGYTAEGNGQTSEAVLGGKNKLKELFRGVLSYFILKLQEIC